MNLENPTILNNKPNQLMVGVDYSSPLPISQEFANYEKILPGAAERILAQAAKEQQNRFLNDSKTHESNQQILDSNQNIIKNSHREKMLGISVGGAICTVVTIFGGYLILKGHDWAGASMICSTVVGVAVAFVTGRSYGK